MVSKYDSYWESRLPELKKILEEAHKRGKSGEIDVSGIVRYGDRGSWYGNVTIFSKYDVRSENAHTRSLGKTIVRNKLLEPYKNCVFRLTVSSRLKLSAEKIADRKNFNHNSVLPPPVSPNENHSYTPDEKVAVRRRKFVEVLKEIPWEVWENIVRREPEWRFMGDFLTSYEFGPFATLMMVVGLNDFQLKGKADEVYWPKLNEILSKTSPPKSLSDISDLLTPFYREERFAKMKIERLNRFLKSRLASELWNSSPQKVSERFLDIWKETAYVMGQSPTDKTICFAMKCLGMSLMMSGNYEFDFSIPIPVDYRVRRFTQNAGLSTTDTDQETRATWDAVLQSLKKWHPNITMIHLDSLIWQIGTSTVSQLKEYFNSLGIPKVFEKLTALLQH